MAIGGTKGNLGADKNRSSVFADVARHSEKPIAWREFDACNVTNAIDTATIAIDDATDAVDSAGNAIRNSSTRFAKTRTRFAQTF